MSTRNVQNRALWLAVGVVAGLCIAYFWPHEPAAAVATDRDSRFAIATVPVRDITVAGFRETMDGVFVLDFLTGTLTGGWLNNQTGSFTHRYFRNLAVDFNLDPMAEPRFAIVSGNTNLASRGRVAMATGLIYVAEMTTGRVHAYGFPFSERAPGPMELILLDGFQFRERAQQ